MSTFKYHKAIMILILFLSVVFCGIELCLPIAVIILVLLEKKEFLFFKIPKYPGLKIYMIILSCGVIVGAYQVFVGNHAAREYIKHLAYILLPILYLFIGIKIGKCKNAIEKQNILKAMFYSGILFCIYDILNCIIKILTHMNTATSLYRFRRLIGTGTQYGVYTLFFGICFSEYLYIRKFKTALYILLIVEIIIHFSRSSILISLIFLFYIFKSGFKTKYIKFFLGFAISLIAIRFIAPSMFAELLYKFTNSFNEISTNRDGWTSTDIVQNWRGYESYKAIERFKSANILEKIFGAGLGAQLDVGEYAKLVTRETTLAYLHNGFFTILMVWGIWGELLYFLMILKIYINIPYENDKDKSFLKVMVIAIVINTLLMHGPFFSVGGAFIYFYLGLLYGINKSHIHEIYRKRKETRNV